MLRGMATNIAAIVYACCKYAFWLLAFWSAIEFILYLVKDDPFNWWSVGLCIFSGMATLVAFIWLAHTVRKAVREHARKFPIRKSAFQELLERKRSDIESHGRRN